MPPLIEDDIGLMRESVAANRSILGRAALLFGSGFNEGLANVLGLPVDAINAGLRAKGINVSEEPFAGSRSIKRGFGALGIATGETVKGENPIEEITQRIGEELGAGAVGTGVGLGLARSGIAASSAFIRPFAISPGRATAIESAISLGGGAGAGIAEQFAPDSPLAEVGGQVAGGFGVGGIIGGSSVGARFIKNLAAPLNRSAIERRVAGSFEQATGRSAQEIADTIEANIAKMNEAIGVEPTTAQAAGDVGLLTAERAASRRNPAFRQQLEEKIIAGKEAVRQTLEMAPPALGDPSLVSDVLDKKISRISAILNGRLDAVRNQAKVAIAAASDVNMPELNRLVRQSLIDAEEMAQKEARQLFQEIDPNISIPTKRLRDTKRALENSLKKGERPEDMPEAVAVIDKLGKKKETIDELMAFRSRISQDIRAEAINLAPNRRRIARLEELKQAIDDSILKDASASDDVAGMYEAARQFFRENVVDKFRHGVAARVLQSGKLGETSAIPESATISQFFRQGKGSLEAAQDLKRALSDNTTAMQAVTDAAVYDFASFSVNADGALNVSKARQWMKSRATALDEFPGVKSRVISILEKGQAFDDLAGKVALTKQRLEKSAARFFLNAEPDNAVRRIMASPQKTSDLREATLLTKSDTDALNGLRASVWREGLRQAEVGTFDEEIGAFFLSPQKLRKFFTANKESFLRSGLYSADELNNVNKIISAAETLNKSVVPGLTTVGSDTAANLQAIQKITGLTLPGLLSRFYAISRGVVSPRFIISEIILRGRQNIIRSLTQGQVTALLEEALIKPDLAIDLLRLQPSGTRGGDIGRRIHAHLLNLGPVLLDQDKIREVQAQERLRQPEVQKSIMDIQKSPDISFEGKSVAAQGLNPE